MKKYFLDRELVEKENIADLHEAGDFEAECIDLGEAANCFTAEGIFTRIDGKTRNAILTVKTADDIGKNMTANEIYHAAWQEYYFD